MNEVHLWKRDRQRTLSTRANSTTEPNNSSHGQTCICSGDIRDGGVPCMRSLLRLRGLWAADRCQRVRTHFQVSALMNCKLSHVRAAESSAQPAMQWELQQVMSNCRSRSHNVVTSWIAIQHRLHRAWVTAQGSTCSARDKCYFPIQRHKDRTKQIGSTSCKSQSRCVHTIAHGSACLGCVTLRNSGLHKETAAVDRWNTSEISSY